MNDFDIDPQLQPAARRVAQLSQQVTMDLHHKARLREELLRRHQELSADTTQRAARTLWARLTGLKRLTLVAPPALAVAVCCSIFLWALQISGHQRSQEAEAARLTTALIQSVPTLTEWQFSVARSQAGGQTYLSCTVPLGRSQRLYMRSDGHALIFTGGRWWGVTGQPSTTQCPASLQWAFAKLPAELAGNRFTVVNHGKVNTVAADEIRYVVAGAHGRSTQVTLWVAPKSGLLIRLEQDVSRRGAVIEREIADYHYQRAP